MRFTDSYAVLSEDGEGLEMDCAWKSDLQKELPWLFPFCHLLCSPFQSFLSQSCHRIQLLRSPMNSMSLNLMNIFSLHLDFSAVFDIVDIIPSFSLKHFLPLLLCFLMILVFSDYFGYISVSSAGNPPSSAYKDWCSSRLKSGFSPYSILSSFAIPSRPTVCTTTHISPGLTSSLCSICLLTDII